MLLCYHDLSPLDLTILSISSRNLLQHVLNVGALTTTNSHRPWISQAFKNLYIISVGLITIPSDIPVNLIFIAQQSSKMHDHFSVD